MTTHSKLVLAAVLVAGASAFAPVQQQGVSTTLFSALEYGPYDGEMWDNETKKTVYAAWDPATPRSVNNFNPFETWEGNSPDASGFYPGEGRYKDPARPDVSYASSVIERGEIEARNANPKAGDVPGCLGCRSGAAGRAAPVAAAPAYAAPVAAVAPVAAAPAYAAPAAAAPAVGGAGGAVMDTLGSLEGPGQVWGAEGIDVGKEESDLKGYDNFGLFVQRLQSSGVAAELAGAGPFTIFAPTDTAIESYEKMFGPFDASVCKLHIVVGKVPTSQVSSATLTTIAGETLTYKRAVRKDFVNDIVIGEKTFGQYNDFPVDVECSNGLIHAISLSLAS